MKSNGGVIIGVIIGLLILSAICQRCNSGKASESDYQAFFQREIAKELRDPKSASYEWSDCHTSSDGTSFEGTCRIRATNGFGAYVTETYKVTGEVYDERIRVRWNRQP